jgi:hypothetical protein
LKTSNTRNHKLKNWLVLWAKTDFFCKETNLYKNERKLKKLWKDLKNLSGKKPQGFSTESP